MEDINTKLILDCTVLLLVVCFYIYIFQLLFNFVKYKIRCYLLIWFYKNVFTILNKV